MIDTECYDANVYEDNEFVILNDAECAEYECDDSNNDFINENVTQNNAIRNENECTDNIFNNNDFIYDTLSVCCIKERRD